MPAVATNGRAGWVDYQQLTWDSDLLTWQVNDPQLTSEGTSRASIPVYTADGTTVVGEADVSQPYRR